MAQYQITVDSKILQQLLSVLNIPSTKDYGYFWSDKLLLLGKDGTIWQVVPTNDGWCVRKWNM